MSDYIDTIAGTIKSLARKAKAVGAQAVETVDKNGTVRGVYAKGTERARAYSRIAKLTVEASRESGELERVYSEIGKLYFEQQRGKAEGFFAPLFAQAESCISRMAELRAESDALRAEYMPSPEDERDIEVEIEQFDSVVSADEAAATKPGEEK